MDRKDIIIGVIHTVMIIVSVITLIVAVIQILNERGYWVICLIFILVWYKGDEFGVDDKGDVIFIIVLYLNLDVGKNCD